MPFTCDLTGVVALITGASRGIGRHFALTLAANGASVAATGRHTEPLNSLQDEIEKLGGRCAVASLNVTDPESVRAGFDAAEATLGPVSVVVNNAGFSVVQPVIEISEAEYDQVLDTNAKGVFLVAREAGRRMIALGQGGRIINIASKSAFRPSRNVSTYGISKAAVTGLTRSLAREWAPHGIRVNAICPGVLSTEMTESFYHSADGERVIKRWPRRRLGGPDILDGLLLMLASRQASAFITGALIVADDGQSL